MNAKDGNNAGLTVIPGNVPNELLAFWMQDTVEQNTNTRYVMARSLDGGVSWTAPRVLTGYNFDQKTGKNRCCFATVLKNRHGRIYMLINRSSGDMDPHENGFLFGCYSDDNAVTFSPEQKMAFAKIPEFDNDDPNIPPTWIPFQPPLRLSSGMFAGGISRYCSYQKFPKRPVWTDEESVCSMYLIENADENPEPENLRISWTGHLTAPARRNPNWHVGQEPSIVEMPDGRLFCVFRTNSGSPWYSVSQDGGRSWGTPDILRFGDGKAPVLHPLSPCPCYTDGGNGCFLFIHNHDGHFGPWGVDDTDHHRRPIYLVRGTFNPNARQPYDFSEPEFFFDDNGIPLGYSARRRADLAIYGSMTYLDGKHVLWYPDRKYFLCGKIIPEKCP